MKNILLLLTLFCSLNSVAQKMRGFYSGTLLIDSSKLKDQNYGVVQNYELALDDYRGKISGYSYVTFILNDTFYYGIRRVDAHIVGDSLIVEDGKMVANNFPARPNKRVGRVITIPLNGQDSLVDINGSWKTTETRKYYSLPGTIQLARSEDSAHSPLIAHLRELNLIAAPSQATSNQSDVAVKPTPTVDEASPVTVKVKKDKTKVKAKDRDDVAKRQVDADELPVKNKEPDLKPIIAAPIKLTYDQRKNNPLPSMEVTADSLILAFYDNGVVDGDSISVYMNGQPVVVGARLTTVANKKVIHFDNATEIQLVLVAENLGTLPPNTGLLTIRDGENLYQMNFSADLQTNATITIRRKKSP